MSDETLTVDFVEYLATSLGTDCDSAFAKLIEWMAHYEPVARRPGVATAVSSSAVDGSEAANAQPPTPRHFVAPPRHFVVAGGVVGPIP